MTVAVTRRLDRLEQAINPAAVRCVGNAPVQDIRLVREVSTIVMRGEPVPTELQTWIEELFPGVDFAQYCHDIIQFNDRLEADY